MEKYQFTLNFVNNRNNVIHYLQNKNIETRPFYPNLNKAKYLYDSNQILKDDNLYSKKGLFLPSGPDQTIKDINRTINLINKTKFFNFINFDKISFFVIFYIETIIFVFSSSHQIKYFFYRNILFQT